MTWRSPLGHLAVVTYNLYDQREGHSGGHNKTKGNEQPTFVLCFTSADRPIVIYLTPRNRVDGWKGLWVGEKRQVAANFSPLSESH